MRATVLAVSRMVDGIVPGGAREAEDIWSTQEWMGRTDDVFRRVKPATPDRHLVCYVVPVEPGTGHLLLGDHVNAGLWLPPGGHVEVDEHPTETARREAREELGIDTSGRLTERPVFLSVTETIGIDAGHTDVSLWFVLRLGRDEPISFDRAEFRAMRWWSPDELRTAGPHQFDPALDRFLAKTASAQV